MSQVNNAYASTNVSSWQKGIDLVNYLKPCVESKIGKSLTCYTESDIDKIKTCNIEGDYDRYMYAFFIAQNANKSRYITNFKSFLVAGMDNQVKTHFTNSDIQEPVGAVLFRFDKGESNYISSEAPLDEELFINTVWDNNIDVYVTLTNKEDNDPVKVRFLRGLMSARVDLHHLDKIYDKTLYGFQISKPKIAQEGDIDVLQAEIFHNKEKRIITHIRCNNWEDAKSTDLQILNQLVNLINKHRNESRKKHSLFVNCFAGIGRTRALIMALHAKDLFDSGVKINPREISGEYFLKNYNSNMLKTGEFLIGYREDSVYDQYLMFERYCLKLKG